MFMTAERLIINYFVYMKGASIEVARHMYNRDKDKYDFVFMQLGPEFTKEMLKIIMEKGETNEL